MFIDRFVLVVPDDSPVVSTPSPSAQSKSLTGAIVGGAVWGLFAAILVAVVLYRWCRRQHKTVDAPDLPPKHSHAVVDDQPPPQTPRAVAAIAPASPGDSQDESPRYQRSPPCR